MYKKRHPLIILLISLSLLGLYEYSKASSGIYALPFITTKQILGNVDWFESLRLTFALSGFAYVFSYFAEEY